MELRRILLCATIFLSVATALHAQAGPPFRTDDPETPGNKHFEINFGFIGDRNPAAGAYQVPDFDFNYGLGDRIQLKFELPIVIEETRPQPVTSSDPTDIPGQVIGGLGESLPGIKWRFYEHHSGEPLFHHRFGTGLLPLFHHTNTIIPNNLPEKPVNFSISTYPQLFLNNPTRSVPRGLVQNGPNFFLPIEMNARIGPIRIDGETGYNFGNRSTPQSWNRGFLIGREFSDKTEAYMELYDSQDANRIPAGRGVGNFATGLPKQREATLGLGGRQSLNKTNTLNLLLMGGRSFQKITAQNSQPSWIAYLGIQVLLGSR